MHIKKLITTFALQDFQIFSPSHFICVLLNMIRQPPASLEEGSVFDIVQSFIYNKFIYG